MSDQDIYKHLREEMRAAPFVMTRESVHGYYTETRIPNMRFQKRENDKFYVHVELGTWPTEHERERKRFDAWLYEKAKAFGWIPHLTSGGCGRYTYRLNGDL